MLIRVEQSELDETIRAHRLWLAGQSPMVGLHRRDLSGLDFSRADLRHIVLAHSDLTGANLRKTNLQQANLEGVNFTDCDMRKANLTAATIKESTIFTRANIRGMRYEETGYGKHDPVGRSLTR